MKAFELITVVFSLFAGIGSLVAWLITRERLDKVEKHASNANSLASQANELSNTANLIARQVQSNEVNRFRIAKIERISQDLNQMLDTYTTHNYRSEERRKTLNQELYPILVNLHKFELALFRNENIKVLVPSLMVDVQEFVDLSYEFHYASEDFNSLTGGDNLSTLQRLRDDDPELKETGELRSSTAAKLKESRIALDNKFDQLVQLVTAELNEAINEATQM